MSANLSPYELRVLRSHLRRPLREAQTDERLKAQVKLSKLGYLELRDGLYRITAEGRQTLDAVE